MIVFEDIFSGSEVCSDAFPFRSIFEDTILEVDAQFITVKGEHPSPRRANLARPHATPARR